MKYNAIAISGLPRSGKTVLIEALSKKLKWKTHSIGGLFRNRHRQWASENNSEVGFEEYWAKIVSDKDILEVNREARELLQQGKVILDSRYASVNAQGLPVAKVFLTAPLDIRAQRAIDSGSMPKGLDFKIDRMRAQLIQRETDEYARGNKIYGPRLSTFDYRTPHLYDLILNTGSMTIEEEAAHVILLIS